MSLQVDSNWSSGNYAEAQRNANVAKILNIVGFVVGIFAWVVVIVIVIADVAVGASRTSTSTSTSGN